MNLWLRLLRVLLAAFRAPRIDPSEPARLRFRVMPTDLDINLHMTNSRYLAFMDLGRLDLILRSGLWQSLRRHGWVAVVGGCMVQFRRPLAPFERFELTTRIQGWDEKWFYIEHRITAEKGLACLATVRGAFLRSGAVVPPESVAARGGFPSDARDLPDSLTAAWQGFRAAD